jgi:hypothetical protein
VVLTTNLQIWNSREVIVVELSIYVVSDSHIIQPPTTIFGEDDSEEVYLLHIFLSTTTTR